MGFTTGSMMGPVPAGGSADPVVEAGAQRRQAVGDNSAAGAQQVATAAARAVDQRELQLGRYHSAAGVQVAGSNSPAWSSRPGLHASISSTVREMSTAGAQLDHVMTGQH